MTTTIRHYRIPTPLPLEFEMHGVDWRIAAHAAEGHHTCEVDRPLRFTVATAPTAEEIAERLRHGTPISEDTPVGFIFKHLEALGLVQRVSPAELLSSTMDSTIEARLT